MDAILSLLDVNQTLFTVFDYPMSYIEFFGTMLNLIAVWLVAKNNIWTWPIGNIAVVLFGILFFQIQLYSDFFEQIYYLITGFYGWAVWLALRRHKKDKTKNDEDDVITYNTQTNNMRYLGVIAIGTLVMGYLISNIHIYLPQYFVEPASYAYLDAFTTVMSFVANILLVHKKINAWYLWIFVDIIGIWLYFVKGVVFVSLLYLVFLFMATKGLLNWRKIYLKNKAAKLQTS